MPFEKIGKLYLVTGVTDLRKGIDGYAALIQSQLHQSPMDHSMYLFCNRDRTKLKCLYFDSTGAQSGKTERLFRFIGAPFRFSGTLVKETGSAYSCH